MIPDSVTIDIDFKAEDDLFSLLWTDKSESNFGAATHPLRKSAEKLLLVRPAKKTYYQILRNKLKWGER